MLSEAKISELGALVCDRSESRPIFWWWDLLNLYVIELQESSGMNIVSLHYGGGDYGQCKCAFII